ncbi:maleylpyruvate isomerase family mycothiol-dependent enzyme [Cryptosporangium japonicum]|uniref:Maleylpyruvate isomerase family mycothiol-dependent enzyme n=1 Tax=Cryptosporangium japonicum TaxID=80872 RepID=A0ABN0U4J4_9ACTN
MDFGRPIDVRPLFPVERAELLALLGTLDEDAWHAPTPCPGWSVHDLVAHVVHDYLRRLSGGRDGWTGGWIPVPDAELGPVLNRANDEFVAAARGLSPRVLIGLLAGFGPQLDQYWASCDLEAPGLTVSWAVPDVPAPTWLDIAREYTEFWVHQQQIRAAVGRPGADSRRLMHPVVDAFLRALPRALDGAAGSSVTVFVTAPIDEAWTARRNSEGWSVRPGPDASPDVRLELAPDTLWQVATRGIEPADARERTKVDGEESLAAAALGLVSIVR